MNLNGPGVYDKECTTARESTNAKMIALIIMGGDRGNGFSVQCENFNGFMAMMNLPNVLRSMADDIERMTKHEAPNTDQQGDG